MKGKILFVSEHDLDSKGGIQHVIESIGTRLSNEFDIDAVVFKSMSDYEKNKYPYYNDIFCIDCDSKGGLHRILENIFRPVKLYINANRIIKKGNYKAVHVHDTLKGAWFLRAAEKHNVPIRIMHCHNPEVKDPSSIIKRRFSKIMRKWVSIYSNVKIGCSEDACKSTFGEYNEGSFVVNNETDMSLFDPQRYAARMNDGVIHFIHVGRFTYQKNHEFLIDVFNEIHRQLPKTTLELVGWGQLENDIKKQIDSFGLSNAVEFTRPDVNVAERLSKASYMIFPSRYEGFGRVLIEAQTMNVMCFASDCIPRETDLGLCEYISLDKSAEEWAALIVDYIINNKVMSKKLDNEKVKSFDINNIMETYAEIYRGNLKTQ